MEIRKIAPDECAELLRGFDYAFFEWTGREIAPDEANVVNTNDVLAVFVNGKLASALLHYKFQQSIRGVVKGMGGIGGVWTYPEHRSQGFVRELIKAAFSEMHELGMSTSMLIPFKDRFYANLGYVTSNANLEVKAPIAALRHTLHPEISGNWYVERVNASSAKDEFLAFMLALAPQQHHGITLPINVTDAQWQEQMEKHLCVKIEHDGRLAAIAIYRINSDFRASLSDRLINIRHMYWRSLDARTKLFGFFASHRDQVRYISMDLPLGSNFYQWFQNLTDPCETKVGINAYMVRVVDVEKAIADLPAALDGKVTMTITDPFCDWNNDTFTIYGQDGKLTTKRTQIQPDAIATIQGISALVYGTLSIEEVEYRNWVTISNHQVRATLTSWFPTMMLYNTFRF
ncbi:MAG: GNAT family N-acetyltransferase [Pseudanabaena sp. CRU_2_10]|nr:GNAT family N-acetyltransferase [Pseudanabaena sp. CRU_2_10]